MSIKILLSQALSLHVQYLQYGLHLTQITGALTSPPWRNMARMFMLSMHGGRRRGQVADRAQVESSSQPRTHRTVQMNLISISALY
jgi:hypothetical protein